jgi:hypothetical protein
MNLSVYIYYYYELVVNSLAYHVIFISGVRANFQINEHLDCSEPTAFRKVSIFFVLFCCTDLIRLRLNFKQNIYSLLTNIQTSSKFVTWSIGIFSSTSMENFIVPSTLSIRFWKASGT